MSSTAALDQRATGSPVLDLGPARRVASAAVREGLLPCATFGVVDAQGSQAMASVSGRDDVDERTIFFLASITKPLVAAAVMRYVDEGRLDLRRPLPDYLPAAGHGLADVTAWHILTHTSGLPDATIEALASRRASYDVLLADALDAVPDYAPGTRYRYASSPWLLLGALMARQSGASFAETLRQRVTGPLGMDDTRFDPRHARRRLVPVHGLRIRNRIVAELLVRFMARATLPGGGLFGTLTDLLAFGHAMLTSAVADGTGTRLLSKTAFDEMAREQTAGIPEDLEDGTQRSPGWALGWAKPRPGWPGGASVVTHGGAAGGRLWVDPELGFAFVFLTNLWGAPDEPAVRILEEVYRAVGAGRA